MQHALRIFLVIAVLGAFAQLDAFAGRSNTPETFIVPGAQTVVLQGQTHKALVAGIYEPLRARILHGARGLVTPESKAVVVMLPGSGAKATSEYGLIPSLTHLANAIRKEGLDPIGVEYPFYYNATKPLSERAPFLTKYSSAGELMAWLNDVLRFVAESSPQGKPKDIILMGRSTGMAVALEALHRYALGDPKLNAFEKVRGVFVFGVTGHREKEIETWSSAETKQHHADPELHDLAVKELAIPLFRGMSFLTEPVLASPRANLPPVYMLIGAMDEYLSREAQLKIGKDFSELHPQLQVTALGLDTYHNAAKSLNYTNLHGREVSAKILDRLKPPFFDFIKTTIENSNSPEKADRERNPGFHFTKNAFFDSAPRVCEVLTAPSVAPPPSTDTK